MKTVKNITKKPLSVPLPMGKRLFLGPGKSGKVSPKAVDHPALVALIEAGELELVSDGGSRSSRGKNKGSGSSSSGQGQAPGSKSVFRSGDG